MLTDRQHRNFWAKVRVNPETGCHEWIAGCFSNGYGQFQVGNKPRGTHRIAFELLHGPIPEGLYVCHTCDNRKCVRREHLFAGTPQDNMSDMVGKGRQARGMSCGQTRHDSAAVVRVRELRAAGWLQRWIAQETGMSRGNVSKILCGRNRGSE